MIKQIAGVDNREGCSVENVQSIRVGYVAVLHDGRQFTVVSRAGFLGDSKVWLVRFNGSRGARLTEGQIRAALPVK